MRAAAMILFVIWRTRREAEARRWAPLVLDLRRQQQEQQEQ